MSSAAEWLEMVSYLMESVNSCMGYTDELCIFLVVMVIILPIGSNFAIL